MLVELVLSLKSNPFQTTGETEKCEEISYMLEVKIENIYMYF